jgi:CBS domain-containing protein
VKVKEVMTANAASCPPNTLLPHVARLMCDYDCGAIPVVDDTGKTIGVVTDRDIACRTVAQGKDALNMTAFECMSPTAIAIEPDASLDEAQRLLETYRIRRLVVTDGGRCVGMLSQADIARAAAPAQTGQLVREVSKQSQPLVATH